MKSNNQETSVVPGAAEWQECQKHEEILAKISTVKGFREIDYSGPYVTWREVTLPLEVLQEIVERGNHDEIMALIKAYNFAVSDEDQHQAGRPSYLSMPEEIQEMIAKRGNQEEIEAYLSCQGFGAKGQEVIISRGNHEEIWVYVSRHGLLPEMQRKLLERGNYEEIATHIKHHSLADQFIFEMIDDVYWDNDRRLFNLYVENRELPVYAQEQMLKILPGWVVMDYINSYGLWNETHACLVRKCDTEVVEDYFKKHHYLCPEGEDALATLSDLDRRRTLIKAYMRYWKNGRFLPKDHFLTALLLDARNNRDDIAQVLLHMPYTEDFIHSNVMEDIKLVREGSYEAIIERIKTEELLHIRALSTLFFERDEELFFTYISGCAKGNYYLC